MNEFVEKLGIDWKLLASQAVNFLFLAVILRIFAYKPIVRMLHERRRKIEGGIEKAEEAERRLKEVDGIAVKKIKTAETEILSLFREAEHKSKKIETDLLAAAHAKETEILRAADVAARKKGEEAERQVQEQAVRLVADALKKTVELDPQHIDERLIEKAVQSVGTHPAS